MSKLLHLFAHLFGINTGMVISKHDADGNLWIGFQCSTCGAISGTLKAAWEQQDDD